MSNKVQLEQELELVHKFAKSYGISRAIFWNSKAGEFNARAYSSMGIAIDANEAFTKFRKENELKLIKEST